MSELRKQRLTHDLLDRVKELEQDLQQQRDTALKLAEKWESGDYGTLFRDFSNVLRAIFEPKE